MKFMPILAAVTLGLAATATHAQEPFPGKTPIEITVLFPAGSSADVTARLLADGLSRQLGVSVIVFNRPGAGGALGYRYVAGQKPDGHALVWNSNSPPITPACCRSTTKHSIRSRACWSNRRWWRCAATRRGKRSAIL